MRDIWQGVKDIWEDRAVIVVFVLVAIGFVVFDIVKWSR